MGGIADPYRMVWGVGPKGVTVIPQHGAGKLLAISIDSRLMKAGHIAANVCCP